MSSASNPSAVGGKIPRLLWQKLWTQRLSGWSSGGWNVARFLKILLLGLSLVFFCLHFLHLTADFPNNSPWMDWSKYTDEGWYSDAAIRHYVTGHWYWKGDFNPAVALPVWPLLEWLVFKVTGVSLAAARALTVCVFGATLVIVYRLMEGHKGSSASRDDQSLAGPLAIFLLCTSPFVYVFERMAILEPLLIALAALGLLAASVLEPIHLEGKKLRGYGAALALMVLLPAIVLTKTTGLFLLPAIFYMVWARAGYRLRPALRLAVTPAVGGVGLWCAYYFLLVRPHYLADYQYLFSANAYTGIDLEPVSNVILNTISDGTWMGTLLYGTFFAVVGLIFFWRPRLLANPLLPSLLLWIAGYSSFLAYHNNLQPRYYLVLAVPITMVVAMGLDGLRHCRRRLATAIASFLAVALALAVAVPDAAQQIGYALHPTYQFEAAAQGVKRVVLADKTRSHLILSISGSDLTLMTGLPSIDDDFGTYLLEERVRTYRPGWYAAWNEVDDDKADALTPLYQMKRVAAFAAYDDPDRNLLILYRLDPASQGQHGIRRRARRRVPPRPLRTRMGQQPSADQLKH